MYVLYNGIYVYSYSNFSFLLLFITTQIIIANTKIVIRRIPSNFSYTPMKLLEPTPLGVLILLKIVSLVSNPVVYTRLPVAHFYAMRTWTLRVSVWTVR